VKYKQNKIVLIRYLLWGLLLILTTQVFADIQKEKNRSYFISPNLQLGLHTKASLESPIKVLIRSGSAVEVIKTKKEFSQIKNKKGDKGWIKTDFLTQKIPVMMQVNILEQALDKAKKQLQEKQVLNKNPEIRTKIDQNKDYLDKIATYELTIADLKEKLKAWSQLGYQNKQAQKLHVEKFNQQLKQRLLDIIVIATGEKNTAISHDLIVMANNNEANSHQSLLMTLKKNYLLTIIIAVMSFIFGVFVMDALNRRRHGGYRV
jgi:SH3 domain protein